MSGESQQIPKSEPDPTVLTTDQLDKLEERVNERVDLLMNGERTLRAEQHLSINRRFAEIDAHRMEQKTDSTKALDAAHSAAKEQISALGSRVDDNRDRITRVESTLEGKASQVTEGRSANASLYAVVGLGITVLLAVLTVVGFIAASGTP